MKTNFTIKLGDGMLPVFNELLEQLESMLAPDLSAQRREHLEADIRGYKEIIASQSENNARKFMEIKSNARSEGRRFKDNEAVIAYMKENKLWERKQ